MIKLTTIVANYNYAHFLKEAVLSVIEQKGSTEVVIVDDGSTDDSRSLIKQLARSYRNIRYHFNETNLGVEKSANIGFSLARGEYVHFFGADDLYLKNSVHTLFHFMDRFPKIPFFCSDFAYFANPQEIKVNRQLIQDSFSFFSPEKVFKLFKTTNFWIPGHTTFVKKEIYQKYGPLDKNLLFLCDWFINHSMALKEGVGYIPQGLIAMRQHDRCYSTSGNSEQKRKVWLYLLELIEKNKEELAPLYKSGILRTIGLKSVYKDLLKTPRYWKYLYPMIKREFSKL